MEYGSRWTPSLVSARSRRLRTIGALLVVGILAMAVYGSTVLMPSIRRSLAANRAVIARSASGKGATVPVRQAGPGASRFRKLLKTEIIAIDAYWSVCALLAVGLMLIAWLDLREVSRSYANARLSLWKDVAERTRNDDIARN